MSRSRSRLRWAQDGEVLSATGEAITDGGSRRRSGQLRRREPLKGSDINVDTDDHVVTLKGT